MSQNTAFEKHLEYAQEQDQMDPLYSFRERFLFPQHNGQNALYFCGNSLGLQSSAVRYLMQSELDDWAKYGVEGHFEARNPWFSYHHLFTKGLCALVGAAPNEVVATNTLTVNLHLLLLSFYRPNKERFKIIMEAGAFPSDQYAIETQVQLYGLDPKDCIIEVKARPGTSIIEEEDIVKAIQEAGSQLALVLFGGVNYYSGQYFNLEQITTAAHQVGAYCGFDLAHAVGNIPLQLHDWQVDFACWCSYKYLNAGPGAVGGLFVHQKHCQNPNTFRLAGWWGNDEKDRFKMEKGFIPQAAAASWQMSNAPVFNMVGLLASLDLFEKTNIHTLREKSMRMTQYLEYLLGQLKQLPFTIISPQDPSRRGAQLSLLFHQKGREIFDYLSSNGVIADWREPNVIRIAPVPMYNNYEDCFKFYKLLLDYPIDKV